MVDIFQDDLKEVREQIDEIDRSIIQLLGKRKTLTDTVVKFKSEHQARAFEPSIEETVLGWRRDYTEKNTNISSEMVVDIFRLVMYDAYHLADVTYQRVFKSESIRNIVILGNMNSYAGLLKGLFSKTGYDSILVQELDGLSEINFKEVDAVFITMPLREAVIAVQNQPDFSLNTLLVAFGNLEAKTVDILGNMHSGPTLGLQPMFSASSKTLTKEVIFICHGHLATRYLWLLDQLKMWGLIPVQAAPADYDRLMLVINSLNLLINMSDAIRLVEQRINVDTLMKSIGPAYRMSLMSLGRHFTDPKSLNIDSVLEAKTKRMFRQYHANVSRLLEMIEGNDRDGLVAEYQRICDWFGESAETFDREANRLSKLQPYLRVDGTLTVGD